MSWRKIIFSIEDYEQTLFAQKKQTVGSISRQITKTSVARTDAFRDQVFPKLIRTHKHEIYTIEDGSHRPDSHGHQTVLDQQDRESTVRSLENPRARTPQSTLSVNIKAMTPNQQIWQSKPDEVLLNEVLMCFKLYGLDDHSTMCKCTVGDAGAKLWQLRHKLECYYRPNKYHRYFEAKPRFHRCITILRQMVRLYDHHVEVRESTAHPCGRRYSVLPDGQDFRRLRWRAVENILTFD